jgi:hypothetical protein
MFRMTKLTKILDSIEKLIYIQKVKRPLKRRKKMLIGFGILVGVISYIIFDQLAELTEKEPIHLRNNYDSPKFLSFILFLIALAMIIIGIMEIHAANSLPH